MAVYHVSLQKLAGFRSRQNLEPIQDGHPPEPLPAAIPTETASGVADAEKPKTEQRVRSGKRKPAGPKHAIVPTAEAGAGPTIATNAPEPGVGAPSSGESAAVRLSAAAPLPETVAAWLKLPREELSKMLADSEESSNKVWLALIYRLSALESQVADLSSALRSAGRGPHPPSATRASGGRQNVKPELLEQVFQKNLSLRRREGDKSV